jgi:hypothetical protein
MSSQDESIKYMGNKIPIEKSPFQRGFFFIMTNLIIYQVSQNASDLQILLL